MGILGDLTLLLDNNTITELPSNLIGNVGTTIAAGIIDTGVTNAALCPSLTLSLRDNPITFISGSAFDAFNALCLRGLSLDISRIQGMCVTDNIVCPVQTKLINLFQFRLRMLCRRMSAALNSQPIIMGAYVPCGASVLESPSDMGGGLSSRSVLSLFVFSILVKWFSKCTHVLWFSLCYTHACLTTGILVPDYSFFFSGWLAACEVCALQAADLWVSVS